MQVEEFDFDRWLWHDCHIWGIAFRCGEPSEGDWTSELLLDIDFICEWCCANEKGRFRVAPALLVFHGVQGLQIDVKWDESTLAYPIPIAEVSREPIGDGLALGKQNYRWCIKPSEPFSGELAFSAFGFTQSFRSEPVLIDEQCLAWAERQKLIDS